MCQVQVSKPWGNGRVGGGTLQTAGHLLGLKGRGGREGSQGTAELARRVLCVWEMQGEKGGWQEKGHVGQARRRLGKRRVCTLLYKICFYISI